VPDQLHLVRLVAAERRHRRLGEPRGDADAQFPRDELEERPAPGLVERVEPAGDAGGQVALRGVGEPLHDLGEGGDVGRRVVVAGAGGGEPLSRMGEGQG
jgi:hypothetical protein